MAEPNTRLVVIGAGAADAEFDAWLAAKKRAEKEAEKARRALEKAERDLRRRLGQ